MKTTLMRHLDKRALNDTPLQLWLRDDDVTVPSSALDRLLQIAENHRIPLTLAAIPLGSDQQLAERLAVAISVSIVVHGWSHSNQAGPGEKPQELGAHRPTAVVLDELKQGFTRLQGLVPNQFVPVLVPPWNRIDCKVVAGLPALGFRGLSVFGPAKPAPLAVVNTHVDLMDWRGTRGGRASDDLFAEILAASMQTTPVGILSHHLVHDAQAWRFLDQLFDLTANHPGCIWQTLPKLLPLP